MFAQRVIGFETPLSPWAWAALAAVPAGIVLLYFLKLRRHSVQVPSTLLWRRTIEDLHVNSLFQRLRKNLLLFLQLLVVGLVLLALTGPRTMGIVNQGQRIVLAIDESASMGATDVEPSRLEQAKLEARKIIGAMSGNDLAMIVAFSNSARVVTNYTSDKDLLRSRLDSIQVTDAATAPRDCLQLVAGLANPQKYVELDEGQRTADKVEPKLFLITDGGFADVEGFSLGAIKPEVIPIGPPPPAVTPAGGVDPQAEPDAVSAQPRLAITPANNLAIMALQSARDDDDPEKVQVIGRVRNHRAEAATTQASLYRLDPTQPGKPGKLVDALALEIPPLRDQSFQFDLQIDPASNLFEVRIDAEDDLALDNRASVVVGNSRRARVALVTEANRFLNDTFRTEGAQQLTELTSLRPDDLANSEVKNNLAGGAFDLVIFDGVRPESAPEASTLYIGVLPPGLDGDLARPIKNPIILDWDASHPLLQYVRDLNLVAIDEAVTIEPPNGARVLIESDQGPIAFAIPRAGYVDIVLGFALLKGPNFNTNWPVKTSFPLFLFNTLRVLGRARGTNDDASTAPGTPVVLRPDTLADQLDVVDPRGRKSETIARNTQGTFVVNQTQQAGIYQARWGDKPDDETAFAVNLFDARESDLSTRGQVPVGVTGDAADAYKIKIGHTPVDATTLSAPAQQEWWWMLALLALVVVVVEWIVYNKRVFV